MSILEELEDFNDLLKVSSREVDLVNKKHNEIFNQRSKFLQDKLEEKFPQYKGNFSNVFYRLFLSFQLQILHENFHIYVDTKFEEGWEDAVDVVIDNTIQEYLNENRKQYQQLKSFFERYHQS